MATTATRTNPLSYLTGQLNELEQKGTYFKLRVLGDEPAPVCTFDGKKVINLASNCSLANTGGYWRTRRLPETVVEPPLTD